MNLTRVWAWRPDVTEAFAACLRTATASSNLDAWEVAVVVCATAASLGEAYCSLAWGGGLATGAAAVLTARRGDSLSAHEQALAGWARKLAHEPNGTTAADVAVLRVAGLSDRDTFDTTVSTAMRLAFATVNDALGVAPNAEIARSAPALVREAVRLGRSAAEGA